MQVRRLTAAATAAALFATLGVSTVLAAGSAEKATGDVSWARGGTDRAAEFEAHEATDGRPPKGELTQSQAGQSFTVDVDRVEVSPDGNGGGKACFAGEIVDATGAAVNRLGNTRVTFVVDGGTPGSDGDLYVGRDLNSAMPTFEAMCTFLEGTGDNAVTGGNLQVHG